jgi:hypothetical protein
MQLRKGEMQARYYRLRLMESGDLLAEQGYW